MLPLITQIAKRRSLAVAAGAALVAIVVIAAATTWFGVGVATKVLKVDSGEIWMWSRSQGEAQRVNVHSGAVDTRRALTNGQGHEVTVMDDGRNLLLHDRTAGSVTSVDLATLGTSAQRPVERGSQTAVAMWRDKVLVIDTAAGTASTVDPENLSASGQSVALGRDVTPGAFDGEGTYWLASAAKGQLIGLSIGREGVHVAHRTRIAPDKHTLQLSALDSGVAVVDSTAKAVTVYTESKRRVIEVDDLQDTWVAPRTIGERIAITVPTRRTVLLVSGSDVRRYAIPGEGELGEAIVFGDRLYIADAAGGTLLVLNLEGSLIETVPLPAGEERVEFTRHDSRLLVTAPGSEQALLVDPDAKVRQIRTDKTVVTDSGRPTPQPDRPSQRPDRNPDKPRPGNRGTPEDVRIPSTPQLPSWIPSDLSQYRPKATTGSTSPGRNGTPGQTNTQGQGIDGAPGSARDGVSG